MNKITYIFLVVLLLTALSCGEDFVTKEYRNGVVEENFFQNADDAEQALTAVYDILSQRGMYKEGVFPLGESSSDNIDEQTGDNGDYGFHYRAISDYRWVPDNPYFVQRWLNCYSGILRANILLEKLPAIEMEDELRNRMAAEAKFLRGLYYFTLIISYGDVPLITQILQREEYNELPRVEQALLYAQVEQDLQEAAPHLQVEYEGENLARITRGAAYGLLSRVYLYQNKWAEAVAASEQVFGLNKYSLLDDYGNLFNGKSENNEENLLEIQFVGRATPSPWTASSETLFSFLWSPMIGWANWFTPSRELIDSFEENDKRRKASLLLVNANDSIDLDGDGVLNPFPDEAAGSRALYFTDSNVRKFLPEGQALSDPYQYGNNFPAIRYAEILLNYAEALNELGRSAEALTPLNEVRERAGLSTVNETAQSELRDIIYHERRLELVFEGHRFFDLKRQGRAEEVLGPLGYQDKAHRFFPIPREDIDLNPKLEDYSW